MHLKFTFILSLIFYSTLSTLFSQEYNCEPTLYEIPLSNRVANYKMKVRLDAHAKKVEGTSEITWNNESPDTITYIRMYMYLNAFSNMETSMLRDERGAFDQDLSNRTAIEWGSISITNPIQRGSKVDIETRYVQPDDENKNDKTVLELILNQAVLPGETTTISFNFVSKLPRTIARSGYGENDFFHFVHWYPKIGVYEQNENGKWNWNCHQFLPRMEFYGDFGNYDITIEAPQEFVIGASGCRENNIDLEEGYKQIRYIAKDVIDFAWCASPLLEVIEDQWEHVEIRLLSPRAHSGLRNRLIDAAKNGLTYLKEHIGEYPYNTLTILDPPMHGLRSGFMEYPTYITGGSFSFWPSGLRTVESLIIHELSHQYYMQMLASNEKEAPWLDEGFVTFTEDQVMSKSYTYLIDIMGYKATNAAFTRNEFVKSARWRSSPISTIGWKFKGAYKETIYAKTATFLQTLRMHLGDKVFDKMMKNYFEENKFTHPRRQDFEKHVLEAFSQDNNILSPVIDEFLLQVLDSTSRCDYAVKNVTIANHNNNYISKVILSRLKNFRAPVDIKLTWSDGSVTSKVWDGLESEKIMTFEKPHYVTRVDIDPEFKLRLDINYNNNSYVAAPPRSGIYKYASRALFWAQNILHTSSLMI